MTEKPTASPPVDPRDLLDSLDELKQPIQQLDTQTHPLSTAFLNQHAPYYRTLLPDEDTESEGTPA